MSRAPAGPSTLGPDTRRASLLRAAFMTSGGPSLPVPLCAPAPLQPPPSTFPYPLHAARLTCAPLHLVHALGPQLLETQLLLL